MAATRCLRPSPLLARPTAIWSFASARRVQSRRYHDPNEDERPTFTSTESQILSAALKHVPEHGFSEAALRTGARDAGYLDASSAIFARGPFELVRYHLVTRRQALRDEVQFTTREGSSEAVPGVGARVRALTLQRLRRNAAIIHHWQDALALAALPSNAPVALGELAALADEIWHCAGDTAVDFSWYTKRSTLAAIYASSELFMTTDASAGFAETEAFLDRRLEELRGVAHVLGSVGEWAAFSGRSALNVARSKGVPF